MAKVPQPIPYQGSKRRVAGLILSFLPPGVETLIEPFAGSAAVSLAAAAYGKASRFHLNDLNAVLMELWREIIERPYTVIEGYRRLWTEQIGREKEFYHLVRDDFNRTGDPIKLLYLLARCVKAAVRYNSRGEFNQSADNRRKGRHPDRMAADILAASWLLRGRVRLTSVDYAEVVDEIGENDVLYLDPPYQGVSAGTDPRYYGGVDFERFVSYLESLIERGVAFILSYDGRRGQAVYGNPLPFGDELYGIEVESGRSAQATLLGRNEVTYESLYLSRALLERIGLSPGELAHGFWAGGFAQLPLPMADRL